MADPTAGSGIDIVGLLRDGGPYAFAFVCWLEVRSLRPFLKTIGETLAGILERARIDDSAKKPQP